MAHLERILVYPIKSLDAASPEAATVVDGGALERDRRYVIVDADGEYVNGKRERRVHGVRAAFDLERNAVTLRCDERADGDSAPATDPGEATYDLDDDRDAVESWLSAVVGYDVELRRNDEGGFPDDTDASGPTVIGTGTLEAVASWFDGIDAAEMRRRLRPNLELAGVPAFWEDRLYEEPGRVVPFTIGTVELRGVNPCQRCVVPTRDPDTGEPTPGFRETFVERREATLPEWAGTAWFDHYFRLMVNTRVSAGSWGRELEVGDAVDQGDPVSEDSS